MADDVSVSDAPVSFIGHGQSDTANVTPRSVGAKAYNLAQLDRLGLNVPPAVVLGAGFFQHHGTPEGVDRQALSAALPVAVRRLENATGTQWGSGRRPLLVSVRSSGPVSMPGMMDTVLNVGLNDRTVRGLIRRTGNPRLAWDSYRRLVESFAVIRGADPEPFAAELRQRVAVDELESQHQLDTPALAELTDRNVSRYKRTHGEPFPSDPNEQLHRAVEMVWRSWYGPRAEGYRTLHGIDAAAGMGVIIQAMVFGNGGRRSGSGVAFTRNPSDGSDELYVDFVFNAQGEDVVGGRTPVRDWDQFQRRLPDAFAAIDGARKTLERDLGDMQDVEFTVQDGEVFFLQARAGKRTPWAALRIAVDAVEEGLVSRRTALAQLAAYDLDLATRTRFILNGREPVAGATSAGIGVASGAIALDSDQARRYARAGTPSILVRPSASPEDIDGLVSAQGVLTGSGGRTSHAAVVARQLGKVCLVGCDSLRIDLARRRCTIGTTGFDEGDLVSLDGNHGLVYAGRLDIEEVRPHESLALVDSWRREADATRVTA